MLISIIIVVIVFLVYIVDKNNQSKRVISTLRQENQQLLDIKNNPNSSIGLEIMEEFYKLLKYTTPNLKISFYDIEPLSRKISVSSLNNNYNLHIQTYIENKDTIKLKFNIYTSDEDEDEYNIFDSVQINEKSNIKDSAKKLWKGVVFQLHAEGQIYDFKTLY